jgi:hypothetical protein
MRNTLRSIALLAIVLTVGACSSRRSVTVPTPASPEAAVQQFMAAVDARNMPVMGDVWGTADRGPASGWMKPEELERRLAVMGVYLAHDEFEVLPQAYEPLPTVAQRVVQVRLVRAGCEYTVPFTLVPHGDGWVIGSIDIAAAGNPARSCEGVPDGGMGGV